MKVIREGHVRELVVVPYNGKIADITETDTAKHTLDLETALSETRKIIMVILTWWRVSGTGELRIYPNEGTYNFAGSSQYLGVSCVIADGTQRLQYAQSVANDDFDLYCLGYVVE